MNTEGYSAEAAAAHSLQPGSDRPQIVIENIRMHGQRPFGDRIMSLDELRFNFLGGSTVSVPYTEVRNNFPEGSDAKYIDTYMQAAQAMASRLAYFSNIASEEKSGFRQRLRSAINGELESEIRQFISDFAAFASDGLAKIAQIASKEGFTTVPEFQDGVINVGAYGVRFAELRTRYDHLMAKAQLNKSVYSKYLEQVAGRPEYDVDGIMLSIAKDVTPRAGQDQARSG